MNTHTVNFFSDGTRMEGAVTLVPIIDQGA
jgi:hypothetical protein